MINTFFSRFMKHKFPLTFAVANHKSLYVVSATGSLILSIWSKQEYILSVIDCNEMIRSSGHYTGQIQFKIRSERTSFMRCLVQTRACMVKLFMWINFTVTNLSWRKTKMLRPQRAPQAISKFSSFPSFPVHWWFNKLLVFSNYPNLKQWF